MKTILTALALVLGTSVVAQARVTVRYSESYTCAQIQATVAKAGEALIYSHSQFTDNDLYDIAYVNGCPDLANRSFSAAWWVPSKDQADCYVGYRCRQRNP